MGHGGVWVGHVGVEWVMEGWGVSWMGGVWGGGVSWRGGVCHSSGWGGL